MYQRSDVSVFQRLNLSIIQDLINRLNLEIIEMNEILFHIHLEENSEKGWCCAK